MAHLEIEQLTPEVIDAAYKFNDEYSSKNLYFRQKTKEFSEILQVLRIGIDRF